MCSPGKNTRVTHRRSAKHLLLDFRLSMKTIKNETGGALECGNVSQNMKQEELDLEASDACSDGDDLPPAAGAGRDYARSRIESESGDAGNPQWGDHVGESVSSCQPEKPFQCENAAENIGTQEWSYVPLQRKEVEFDFYLEESEASDMEDPLAADGAGRDESGTGAAGTREEGDHVGGSVPICEPEDEGPSNCGSSVSDETEYVNVKQEFKQEVFVLEASDACSDGDELPPAVGAVRYYAGSLVKSGCGDAGNPQEGDRAGESVSSCQPETPFECENAAENIGTQECNYVPLQRKGVEFADLQSEESEASDVDEDDPLAADCAEHDESGTGDAGTLEGGDYVGGSVLTCDSEDEEPSTSGSSGPASRQLRTWTRQKHHNQPPGNTSPLKSVRCPVCSVTVSSKRNLKPHMQIHTGEKPFQCDICSETFARKNTLDVHTRVHTGERPYRCDECSKSFARKSHLVEHIRVHTGERPYRCDVCSKSFAEKGTLNKHMRVHTGEKPYRCHECSKSFSQKGSLDEHMRVHTGERPYRCDVCSKSFSQKSHLVEHIPVHTDERPYRCDVCQKSFKRIKVLNQHKCSSAELSL